MPETTTAPYQAQEKVMGLEGEIFQKSEVLFHL